jgi:hypothetical protein
MTDRDPIAAALEDLRKKEAEETASRALRAQESANEEGPFKHFEIVEGIADTGVLPLPLDELASELKLSADPDFIARWADEFKKYIRIGRVPLMVVRPKGRAPANEIGRLLREDGLDRADARELCCYDWKHAQSRFSSDRLLALGGYLLTGIAGPKISGRFVFRNRLPWGGEALADTPDSFLDDLIVESEDFILARVSPQVRDKVAEHETRKRGVKPTNS